MPIALPIVDASFHLTGFGPARHEVVVFDGTCNPATDLALSPEGDFWPILHQRAYLQVFGFSTSGVSSFAVMALTGRANVPAPGAN